MTTKKTKKKSAAIKLQQTEDGLHLKDSILWFDSHLGGDLSFLSSANSNTKTKVSQVITTEETSKILDVYRRKPNALICQYNRPFSIGTLKMELLPSGCILGGASLFLEAEKSKLLYAPQLLTHRIPTVRQMQLKKAKTLILGAAHPDPNGVMPNRKKEKERLLEEIEKAIKQGVWPVLACEPNSTAQEITKLLTEVDVPVVTHYSIYRVNKIYETYGIQLGQYSLFSKKHPKPGVMIFPIPATTAKKTQSPFPDGPLMYVEGTLQETNPPSAVRTVQSRYFISSTCDGGELKEVISKVAPKELYITGPYAKRYAKELAGHCPSIKPLFANDQPTLF